MNRPIAYVARFVPEYRRPILEKLNEQLDGRLIVCAGTFRDPSFKDLSRGPAPGYKRIDLKNRWIGNQRALIQNSRPIFGCDPIVILAEESPRTISLPWLLVTARLKQIGTLLWGHFSSNRRAFSEKNLLDRYRLALAKRVDGCVCYTDEIADLIRTHVPAERRFIARNTLDTDKLFRIYKTLEAEGKERVRARLGIPVQGKTVVFIGRLVADKRPEVLLDLHKALSTIEETTLIIIGDGPERNRLVARVQDENLRNVFLPGTLTKLEESAPWMYAADTMVCPGYVGLNVNHAFCLGLPVVTCTNPDPRIRYHSPEINYLKTGVNGMLASYGDPNSLVKATLTVLENQEYFSSQAYDYAQSHLQLQGMIDGLVQAIEHAESCALKNNPYSEL
ncbi:MAG: glycosyltransferase family 4 protein [Rhodothermaceae bacterium]|nr:glycosyltransferase family 4 protein [Rhodothermaceae bacterium]MXW31874.1 glycosyltransferase family 4 protein [Rhodothermaceae bacterium]MYC04962.1 glycosyltransferase family 4 protein [Rhodothermaceae bacterium]MYE63122.1 glycosyltransferase family 4 protein [Rhodothermaceae bacterium]MYI18020.1 glycosyltransferase family 4 protein [Rhodothermaceae bacterium]